MAFIEFGHHNLQKIKFVFHSIQAVSLLLIFFFEIAVFSKAQSVDGHVAWQFGLVFLTVPALLYLTMTVRFPRTRKFANPYALATVDSSFSVLWISGFAAQATYNSSGKCRGACRISKVIVGLGVAIWLIWVLTCTISLYGVMFWKREGYLPGVPRAPYNPAVVDPDKEAFSTEANDDEYFAVHTADQHDTSYYGAGAADSSHERVYEGAGRVGGYAPPQVQEISYSPYTGTGGNMGDRIRFPEARYENI
ncbi:hypothetical protein K3495_g8936 [Podosphaera aphanis]|nr:hypothetical protein K3495_g8936 [Podosphaera aphanis]